MWSVVKKAWGHAFFLTFAYALPEQLRRAYGRMTGHWPVSWAKRQRSLINKQMEQLEREARQ